jgi:hypothetical protein
MLLGCTTRDEGRVLAEWHRVQTGDTRASVLERLGQPDAVEEIELAMELIHIRCERLVYRTRSQVLGVHLVGGHVLVKMRTTPPTLPQSSGLLHPGAGAGFAGHST